MTTRRRRRGRSRTSLTGSGARAAPWCRCRSIWPIGTRSLWMVETTVAQLGRLDVLVNNAATGSLGGLDIGLDVHDQIMAVDLDAPFVVLSPRRRTPPGGGGGSHPERVLLRRTEGAAHHHHLHVLTAWREILLERMTVDLARQLAPDRSWSTVSPSMLPSVPKAHVRTCPTRTSTTGRPPGLPPRACSGCCVNRSPTPAGWRACRTLCIVRASCRASRPGRGASHLTDFQGFDPDRTCDAR